MCDCYHAKCEECDREIPVHIGDFSTSRDNVLVRCPGHLPTDDLFKWTMFLAVSVEDWDVGTKTNLGNWCMAIRDYGLVQDGYDVGEEGDIVPNCYWAGEMKWN